MRTGEITLEQIKFLKLNNLIKMKHPIRTIAMISFVISMVLSLSYLSIALIYYIVGFIFKLLFNYTIFSDTNFWIVSLCIWLAILLYNIINSGLVSILQKLKDNNL
jgi:hypothetical protein